MTLRVPPYLYVSDGVGEGVGVRDGVSVAVGVGVKDGVEVAVFVGV
jgi:hypothetical protein